MERIEAISKRQAGVPAEGHGDGLFFGCKHRCGRCWPHWRIGDGGAFAPLGHRFGGDAVPYG